ncbi:DNA-binding transcriptional ArsR family regulator [Nonomuraea thailandensis]|uniref:DNA-binding transcriptional ArsR family regulator n=1 Tax=Nonomuraea thailandensis TaxID=1188745 RepID=A0A9X2K162_9ACTN|nr:helix-turn-helix domain-containing protein [Nonomuraea thailandensis]MCP2353186.1 DNA-binding transcriptional ArsR family regulator [Nonomuraea thailandensis]
MTFRHPDRDQIRIEDVLSALGNAVRLAAVRLLDAGGEHNCTSVLNTLGITAKSTMTHHWRVLRDSGVIWQQPSGRENLLVLRRDDLDARYPGLLDAILTGANADATLDRGDRTEPAV